MFILNYKEFIKESKENDDNTIYIFDLDDTLTKSPNFEDLAIDLLKESKKVEELLDKSVKLIDISKKDLKWEHGRIYVQDPNHEIKPKGNWVRKKTRVYLTSPDGFHYINESLPDKLNPLADLYKKVKNKAIVTGRIDLIKEKLEKRIQELGLELPNHGFHCYPQKNEISERVSAWKAKTVVNIIKKGKFNSAKFFDDNKRWVRAVDQAVKEHLPNIDWESKVVR